MEVECLRRCRSRQHGSAICAAIMRGSAEEAVAYMRCVCANCAQVSDPLGRTALHVAAAKGRRKVVEWLVLHRDALINVKDQESGYTALHRSVFYGQIDVAVSLMKMGANVGSMDKEDLTPVDHAMKSRPAYVEFCSSGQCEAYVWGTNANFNLGLGNQQSRAVPEPLECFRRQGISVRQVALHTYHSVFVTSAGRVYSCGHGQGGRLGQATEQPSLLPQPMRLAASEVCVQASIGSDHSVMLMESGLVWTCGSNQQHQLGHNPPPQALLAPRSIASRSLPGKVLGVCAGRFHTVIWLQDAVYTCGLNAGQLGHPKGEPTVITPKQVASLRHADCHISAVASSDAATVVVMRKGSILVLHEYQCRKIASRLLHVKQVAVSGGRLDSDLEGVVEELRVCVLTTTGKILVWQQSTQQLARCHLQLKRSLVITSVALTTSQLTFTTNEGEAFEGFLLARKHVTTSASGKAVHEDCEQVRVRKLARVHRAVAVSCDPRGRNFAVVQAHPKQSLVEVPQVESSTMRQQMASLLQEASEEDVLHDVVFEVGGARLAAHRSVVAASSAALAQMMATSDDVIKLPNLKAQIFQQILQFIYTNHCDLLTPGPCDLGPANFAASVQQDQTQQKAPENPHKVSAFQAYGETAGSKKSKTRKRKTSAEVPNDPLRGVAATARQLGLQSFSKALDSVYCKDGMIQLRPGWDPYVPTAVSFDRDQLAPLCDVSVTSVEGEEIRAHRAILAARLEYFHSMFAHGWAESSRSAALSMALPAAVLRLLLDFLYLDKCPEVHEDAKLARAMLVVADQMFIERLKEECECALASGLTLCNAAELLQLADTYNAPQLKMSSMQFICINLPAILESRALDDVEWSVLSDLTKYYREFTPAMWTRFMSPYCETPSSAELESILASCPVDLDQHVDPEERRELIDGKKLRIKKRHRIRRVSSGEPRVRKESMSSNASEDCAVVQALPVAKEVTLHPVLTPPATPPHWNVMFPELTTSIAALDLNPTKTKAIEIKKMVKLSQKQRKRLASESAVVPVPSKPAWGLLSSSPGGLQGSSPGGPAFATWGPQGSSPGGPAIATWGPQGSSPGGPAIAAAPSPPGWGPSFQAIVADELQQRQNLERVRTKSLHLTQIEDKAMEDLCNFYGAHDAHEERICVRRVQSGVVATPVWVSRSPHSK